MKLPENQFTCHLSVHVSVIHTSKLTQEDFFMKKFQKTFGVV